MIYRNLGKTGLKVRPYSGCSDNEPHAVVVSVTDGQCNYDVTPFVT